LVVDAAAYHDTKVCMHSFCSFRLFRSFSN
jgi:hypothetical protein